MVDKVADLSASVLSPGPMASISCTKSDARLVASHQDSFSLGKRQDTERGGRVLKRLGASLMQPFMVLRERFSHLLRNAGGSTAGANGADEPTVPLCSRPVAPPCFYALAGAENALYGRRMDSLVESLDTAASVFGQKQTVGQRLLKALDSIRKWFCCSAHGGESHTPDQQKYEKLFKECRENATAPRATHSSEGASDVANGLTALYLEGFGRELTAEAVQGLVAEEKKGASAVDELATKLKATKDVATCYRSLPLKEVLTVMGQGQYFLNQGDALAVFLDGVVAFAGEIAKQRRGVQTFISQDEHFTTSVQTLLGTLTPIQKAAIKLRLNDFLVAKAYRIFDFAKAQSYLFLDDRVARQLLSLSLGEQVMEPLLEALQLQLRHVDDIPADTPVSALDTDELAALSRVLVHAQISKN